MKTIVKNHELYNKTLFGFWVYLMTDCVLFATLFAAYIILQGRTFAGPSSQEIFSLGFAFWETIVLLTSSFTIGLARLDAHFLKRGRVIFWLAITALLGATFLAMELHEFAHFVEIGASWRRSAFLSSYFTLVATHGCHITIGLVWIIMTMILIGRKGVEEHNFRRLTCLGIFWHFLDLVWIFIFSVVYLMGVLP